MRRSTKNIFQFLILIWVMSVTAAYYHFSRNYYQTKLNEFQSTFMKLIPRPHS